jgi:hypothetical protein
MFKRSAIQPIERVVSALNRGSNLQFGGIALESQSESALFHPRRCSSSAMMRSARSSAVSRFISPEWCSPKRLSICSRSSFLNSALPKHQPPRSGFHSGSSSASARLRKKQKRKKGSNYNNLTFDSSFFGRSRSPAIFLGCLGESFQKILPIYAVRKNIFPPIITAHHVINGTRILNLDFSRHPALMEENRLIRQVCT